MTDNISDKDKKDWENFISSKEKLLNKDAKLKKISPLKIKSVATATILGPKPIEQKVEIKKNIATTWALIWFGAIIWMATGDIACCKNIVNEKIPSIIVVIKESVINGVNTIIGISIQKTIKAHLIGASMYPLLKI